MPLTATFLAGLATVDVVVTPLVDADDGRPESVILTLTTVAPYELGAPATATVTITDTDSAARERDRVRLDRVGNRSGHWHVPLLRARAAPRRR